ncbi:MAG: colanic acid biosynthesis acetyltransferase WcaF, partial [Gemmatimonadales bacterium]|nr:colanic acid biosynthesis acetyltransferase WcaF [Gemmatimonadales bacterium]
GVRVKFPWRLMIADHVWIGEGVWIDNLATVTIRDHCCISQGAYLCTGSHDWESATFNLITKPIEIHEYAWVGAQAVVGPGVVINEGAVLGLGSVATQDLESWQIYQGVPAQPVRPRRREIDYHG